MMACPSLPTPLPSKGRKRAHSLTTAELAEHGIGQKRRGWESQAVPPKKQRTLTPSEHALQLSQQARLKSHPPFLHRVIPFYREYSDPEAAATLHLEAAKEYEKLLQFEQAAECYTKAAECYEQDPELLNEETECYLNAAKRYMEAVTGAVVEPLAASIRDELLLRAADQWDEALICYQQMEEYKSSRDAAVEKGTCYLLMEEFKTAAKVFLEAGRELTQQNLHEINRFLLYCTSCRILNGAHSEASASYDQIEKNFGRQANTGGRKKARALPDDLGVTNALCSLSLDMEEVKEAVPLTTENAVRFYGIIIRGKGPKVFYEAMRNYIETRKPEYKHKLKQEANGVLDNLLLTSVLDRLNSFPADPQFGPFIMKTSSGHSLRLWGD